MAQAPMFRINQLSKDFDIKTKDLLARLDEAGMTGKKTMTVLEPDEANLLLDTLTKENQIKDIDGYLNGKTVIPAIRLSQNAAGIKEERAAKEKADAEAKAKAEAEKKALEKKAAEEAAQAREKAEREEKEKAKDAALLKMAQAAKARADAEAKAKAENDARRRQKAELANENARRTDDARRQFAGNTQAQKTQNQKLSATQTNSTANNGAAEARNSDSVKKASKSVNSRIQQAFENQKKQSEVRGQDRSFTPDQSTMGKKKNATAPVNERKRTGATRLVDTRGGSVDLSKYDEKLDNYVTDRRSENASNKQKLKKQNTRDNRSQKNRNKESAALDKLRRQEGMKAKQQPLKVQIPDEISVGELASRLKVTSAEVVKRLMMMGMMVTVNQIIDYDTAYLVADELGAIVSKEVVVTIEEKLFNEEEDKDESLEIRPPVVCVMGHVDHGKTSLLDAIRHTNVTGGEAGGITQHIGAYTVNVDGKDITFLDTPGHEAFTAMRARGAQATDIAILVVAADDGIMPQTVEAINHAKAAGVDIIVAINKMDKPTANPDAVKTELTNYNLVPEEWGGDVICVPVSAVTKAGIPDLLENILLIAEVKEFKANPNRRAKGIVIEAKLDRGRGPVATVLVQNGTLKSGDIVIAGTAVGRVRAMIDDKGKTVKEAGPSVPVEIVGLAEVPSAGDEFNAVEDERMARTLAEQRRSKAKEEEFKANAKVNLDDLFAQIKEGVKELNIIVKADVGGSAEAVKQSLEKISNDEVRVKVIHSAVGGITEGDVMLAAASNAIIVGFNVRPDKSAIDSSERQGVDIRTYRIIYECIEEITAAMKGMLSPEFVEKVLGHAQVRQTIHVPNVGTIAGSYVQDGSITRASQIRVVRDGVVVFEDKISSLKRFKDDVKEVQQGYECGIGLEKFNDIKENDILEAYIMEEVAR